MKYNRESLCHRMCDVESGVKHSVIPHTIARQVAAGVGYDGLWYILISSVVGRGGQHGVSRAALARL